MDGTLPASPFLYVLTSSELGGASHAELAGQAAAGGAALVQLRAKGDGDRWLLEQARLATGLVHGHGARLIVNDRVDIALLAGADGVHVGGDDLPPAEVRRICAPGALVGVSTHSVEQALHAQAEGVDYVALGPIFATTTKPGRAALGCEAIRRVKQRIGLPLVAIGGISLARVAEVVDAGADGVAVVAAAMVRGQVEERTRALCAALARGGR